jgi:hypothetical protein
VLKLQTTKLRVGGDVALMIELTIDDEATADEDVEGCCEDS